jgi:hypothetical protein
MNFMQGWFYIWLASIISNEFYSPIRDTSSHPSEESATLEEAGSTTGVNSLAMDAATLMLPADATWEPSGGSSDVESDAD